MNRRRSKWLQGKCRAGWIAKTEEAVVPVKTARYEVYAARDGWRWRLRAANGRIVATGEAHTRRRDALRAVDNLAILAVAAASQPAKVD